MYCCPKHLPDLAGRLSRHIFTRPLTTEHLRTILTREGGLLQEYRQRYESYGCRWAVGDGGIISMVEAASRLSTGARALDHIVDKRLGGELLFQASTSERDCRVTLEPGWPKARLEYM